MNSLPNILTLIRILIIPLVVIFLLINQDWSRWVALILYAIAGITDFFDGYLARHMGYTSALGRFLDPVADKLLVATVIMTLLIMGAENEGLGIVNGFAGMIIVLREMTVSGLREYLAEIQVSVPVSNLARWKTTFQILCLGFLIVGDTASPSFIPSGIIGITLLWFASMLTIITSYDYLRAGLKYMINDDR